MKPTPSPIDDPQLDLFRSELASIIDLNHPMAKLAHVVDWEALDKFFGESYCEDNGRAAILHGNPYDGHTLSGAIEQIARLAPKLPDYVFVDRGYRGHDYEGDIEVHVDKVRRGRTKKSLWKWMKRRAAVEPSIGHLKTEHRMDRNRLKGQLGDQLNAILSAAGMNFSKLLRWLEDFFLFLRCLTLAMFPPMSDQHLAPENQK